MNIKENYFYKTGKFYGYPDCCISDFINKIRTKEQIKASRYTGFMPCVKHAKEILSKKPNQRIIFASGYLKSFIEDQTGEKILNKLDVMEKPFSLSQLVRKIQTIENFKDR